MPTRRDTGRELTDRQEMDLLGWVSGEFETDEERRTAWEAHAERLMAVRGGGLPGTRPREY